MSEQMSFEGFGLGTGLLALRGGQSPAASPDGQMIARSSQPVSRASRGARRAAEPRRTTQGIYGPIHCPSSVDSCPKSPWESRLMALMETFGSTERELTWKRLDTASGQSYFQLAVSTPRPVDIAGGGLPAEPPVDAKLWSGLRSTDVEKGGPNMKFGAGGMPLPAEVALIAEPWPIVSARDHKSDASQKSGEEIYGTNGKPLARTAMEIAEGIGTPTTGPSDQTATSAPGASKRGASRGSLAPAFAAWLQGYPQAHLNCAPSCLPKAKRSGRTKSKATGIR